MFSSKAKPPKPTSAASDLVGYIEDYIGMEKELLTTEQDVYYLGSFFNRPMTNTLYNQVIILHLLSQLALNLTQCASHYSTNNEANQSAYIQSRRKIFLCLGFVKRYSAHLVDMNAQKIASLRANAEACLAQRYPHPFMITVALRDIRIENHAQQLSLIMSAGTDQQKAWLVNRVLAELHGHYSSVYTHSVREPVEDEALSKGRAYLHFIKNKCSRWINALPSQNEFGDIKQRHSNYLHYAEAYLYPEPTPARRASLFHQFFESLSLNTAGNQRSCVIS